MFSSLNVSHVTCHVSHVTCHMSPVTCHMSHVFCHLSPDDVPWPSGHPWPPQTSAATSACTVCWWQPWGGVSWLWTGWQTTSPTSGTVDCMQPWRVSPLVTHLPCADTDFTALPELLSHLSNLELFYVLARDTICESLLFLALTVNAFQRRF